MASQLRRRTRHLYNESFLLRPAWSTGFLLRVPALLLPITACRSAFSLASDLRVNSLHNASALSAQLDELPAPLRHSYVEFGLLLLILLIGMHLLRRRIQAMKGRMGVVLEERNRISRECHDTLMAGLAAISWQLEATTKLFHDSGSENTPTAKSCELARSMVAHCQAEARRIIWDLRGTDEITNILSHALGRALDSNTPHGGCKITFAVEGNELPLAPGCVHHLVCIGQEAVSNAVRHAQPSHVLVLLKYDDEGLSLSVHDDGCGFQSTEMSASSYGHFGIPVMEERARKLGGTLRVQTSAGAGTEVTVKLSFPDMRERIQQEQHVIRWIGV